MPYNKNTNWSNEEEYLNNLIKSGSAGEKAWAQNQLGVLSQAKSQYGNANTPATPSATTNPYNENTNFANESAYLTDLSKNGSAGEQAWANNQMSILNDAMTQYGVMNTSSPTMLKSTPTTGNTKPYNPDTDYQSLINEAVSNGDLQMAAIYEQLRNQKILNEGLDYETTDLYSSYLGGKNNLSASGILSWNDIYNTENPKPTYEEPTVKGKKYSEEIENILNDILSRDDFSYNVETDPLFAQYKTMYNREGDRAMRDTLAEAASSAGGMNSYAITAAQQANNYYASQLNDKIPELHQLAYEMYLQDKESKVQDLGLLSQMDDKQYSRYRDTMSDYWNDKNFAYGAYTDAISQGNFEKTFDYNQSVDDRNYQTNQQSAARDDVWKLISIGVTPSADLVAKAGMSQTDIDLAVAAMKGSSTGDSGNTGGNGYTGNTGDTGDNTDFTGNTSATTGITEEIKNKCAGFTSNTALANYIDGLVSAKTISSEDGDKLYAQYVDDNEKYITNDDGTNSNTYSYGDMVKSTNGWEVVNNGGVNWFWGIDNNAVIKAPNGEQIRLDILVDKLVSEGMSKNEAKAAVKALQKNLQID